MKKVLAAMTDEEFEAFLASLTEEELEAGNKQNDIMLCTPAKAKSIITKETTKCSK